MAKVLVSDQYLTNIANAIREKNETNITYTPAQMASAILSISTGGGSVSLQNKTITPTESQQTINCDSNYDGLGTVTVNGIDSTYVGTRVDRQAAQIITPSTSNQTIAANTYLTSTQTIAGNADLTAVNIKHGVNIFGTTGTFGAKIGVVTTTPSSRSSSITFTDLQAEPLAFIYYMSAQGITSKSYCTCCPVVYDGNIIRNNMKNKKGGDSVGRFIKN